MQIVYLNNNLRITIQSFCILFQEESILLIQLRHLTNCLFDTCINYSIFAPVN